MLGLLSARLEGGLLRRVAAHRQGLVARYTTWHDKYSVTLLDLETARASSAAKVGEFLAELGYE
jgi:hypothetical protein